jgi:hypothetical protein
VRVFENRVLRRIFGPKMDEVTGGWRKLLNEELHDLYFSPSTMGEKRNVYGLFVGKSGKETTRKTKTEVDGY